MGPDLEIESFGLSSQAPIDSSHFRSTHTLKHRGPQIVSTETKKKRDNGIISRTVYMCVETETLTGFERIQNFFILVVFVVR